MNNSSFHQNKSCVQTNSVESQFATLNNDRDKFADEKVAAELEHGQVVKSIQHLKSEKIKLMSTFRTSQEELGDVSRKHDMLEQTKTRLGRVTTNESRALEECALHSKNLLQKESDLKKEFTKETDKLNDETSRILNRQFMLDRTRHISSAAVEKVLGEKLRKGDQPEVAVSLHQLKKAEAAFARAQKLNVEYKAKLAETQKSNQQEVGTFDYNANNDAGMCYVVN